MSDKHTKILLIEDNLGYAHLVQKVLAVSSQVEYQIECADRLSTGLEHLVKGEIDVVLLDLGLPDSQGLNTLSKVRAQAPAVPIVVVTGLDDETLAIQAVRQGAQDYLVKGDIDSKTLRRVLRYAVERKWAEEALHKSEEKYHTLYESSKEGIAFFDMQGNLIEANPALSNMLGYTVEEIKKLNYQQLTPKKWREMEADIIKRQIVIKGYSNEYEKEYVKKDGTLLPITIRLWLISDEQGNSAGMWAIIRDISEQKKIQLQLVRAEKMSALGTMAAGVAHELLNPMMGMINFAQYCLEHTVEGDPRYPVLQDIERETRRCADIVGNLTTFSRMGKQGEEGHQKESFATIIGRAAKLLSYRIEREHVSLTQHVAEDTPKIWMEINSMQQVLLNLISNALDALLESQKKEIHVEAHREGDFIQLTVADSGCGLAPENLEKIYDPFFTTKPIGQGTGLGLTTSRSIIESHGGDITCESKLGAGTIFKVLLPVKTNGGKNEYKHISD